MATTPLQTVPPSDLLPTGKESLATLASLLQLGQEEFMLAFARYEHPSQRARLISNLRQALPEWRLVEVSLQDLAIDLRNLSGRFFETLREIAERSAGGQPFDAVLLLDWEQRFASDLPPNQQPSTSLTAVFNMGRNILQQTFSCPFVVFVPQDTMRLLQTLSPDFVSWKSGTFFFPSDPAEVEADLRAAVEAARAASNSDREAVAQRLEAILPDALRMGDAVGFGESAPADLVADALALAGDLYLNLNDPARAEVYFDRLERWAEKPDAAKWKPLAQRGLREAAQRKPQRSIALNDETWKILRGASALADDESIFGREEDHQQILKMLIGPTFRCGALWGETGCGKTSLVRAGLIPSLRNITESGTGNYLPVYVNRYDNLEAALCAAVARAAELDEPAATLHETLSAAAQKKIQTVVLFCDQFEQVFINTSRQQREPFLRSLAACINDLRLPVRFLFMLRADHLYYLAEFDTLGLPPENRPLLPEYRPLHESNRYELRWLRRGDAARVLRQLRREAGALWTEELMQRVIADLARDGRVKPVEIQLVATGLYLRGINTLREYEKVGGVNGVLKDYLNAVFGTLPKPDLARRVVRELVTDGNPPMRALRTAQDVAKEVGSSAQDVEAVLSALTAPHIVQAREGEAPARHYELVHDVLIEPCLQATTSQEIGLSKVAHRPVERAKAAQSPRLLLGKNAE